MARLGYVCKPSTEATTVDLVAASLAHPGGNLIQNAAVVSLRRALPSTRIAPLV